MPGRRYVRVRGGDVGCCVSAFSCVVTVWTGCDLNRCAICLSVFKFRFLLFYDLVFARLVRRIATPHRNRAELSFVFRYCICAFARVETEVTGCDLNRNAIFLSVFIFHVLPFYDLDLALFVCQIESAPRKGHELVSFFDVAFVRFLVWKWYLRDVLRAHMPFTI